MTTNNIMSRFLNYYWLVIRRCFEGAFLIADGFGLVFLLLSKSQPNVPIAISLATFVIIFLVSSFSVWNEEVQKRVKLHAKLDRIRDDIPKYALSSGAIETYSIENIITECTGKLGAAEARVARQTNVKTANSSIAALVKSMSRLSVLPVGLAEESAEEEAERLVRHLEALETYQEKMRRTYKVPIAFESTRSDNNVEFQVEVPEGTILIVKDGYPINDLPQTHKPSHYAMPGFTSDLLRGSIANANRLYPYSYAEDNKAYSKITKINATRKYNLFDEDFYVQTSENTIVLTATVHSEKLQNKQIIELPLNFEDVPTELLSRSEVDE